MLKIQSGIFKKRKIYKPKSARVLQTKVRQHLFDFLGDFIINANVLDLFAGAGTFGIEALSHGASQVVFVEKNPQAVKKIKKNLELLNLSDKGTVIKSEVILFLNNLNKHKAHGIGKFNVIFIDPPYTKLLNMSVEHQERYIRQLLFKAYSLLDKRAIIILKLHKKIPVTLMEGMGLLDTAEIGINKLYYFIRPEEVSNTIKKSIVVGDSKFVKVGGRQKKKLKKGIRKHKVSETLLYEINDAF